MLSIPVFVILALGSCYCNLYDYILWSLNNASRMTFYGEIVKYRPSSDPRTWQLIAYHMNQYLTEQEIYLPLYKEEDYFVLFKTLVQPILLNVTSNTPTITTNDNATENLEELVTDNQNLMNDTPTTIEEGMNVTIIPVPTAEAIDEISNQISALFLEEAKK
ncbi:some similarities with Saccharomyces cerevisiae YHL044W Putative integral membrane protein, member of DUP240 gene family [Maudiozyma barnettii]|uniref:Some similarities with Saccharomyces cerevisiae YHL044W Putative integral membrane protein, member of DUP240 gene family n=1 Tax=Maudiozyma barnettii TaxID=61262 RepID=A0A8H2ZGL9_9SACH|nr:uncharacterized protein KABA2_04S13244 [Kazachstania barnettii]CAB4254739.1 some similarities with Saccharomyces cerevisiae YHL044W Putative integral membrane protein, member of DUP240 gene family [Kazachstania barnettii]CAD1782782.1 some similarities with Saccharomyces cerevisiae YHL044W Putative integral membrane protein, member of DUP240 gene family [Kazachstania barnettii]